MSASPFLKWAGGKGKLLPQLLPLLPSDIKERRYFEPFLGGGALFFSLAPSRALLSDTNSALVNTYVQVRDSVESLIFTLRRLATTHDSDAYYRVRERYNTDESLDAVALAAMFIYLNKTCFNGLHRVNRDGHFNVPAGRYTNPRILDGAGLRAASEALWGAQLYATDFENVLSAAKPGDFVYFDPPYEPVSETASFTSYAKGGFSRVDQTRLRDACRELDRRGCLFMLSNSDVPFIRDLYAGFRIDTVTAARAINSDASKRGKVSEIVVRNYAEVP